MNILKKITGIFLLILAGILSLAALVSFINAITATIDTMGKSTSEGIGYAFGSLFGIVIIGIVIYFMIKIGLKLISKKKVEVESIDEIGA